MQLFKMCVMRIKHALTVILENPLLQLSQETDVKRDVTGIYNRMSQNVYQVCACVHVCMFVCLLACILMTMPISFN